MSATTRRSWGWLLLVAVVVLVPLAGLLRRQGPPMEEGFMLVFPERVLAGDVPNRDFLHLYGPGSLWALAGIYQLFGVSLVVERLAGFLQQLGIITAVLAIGWRAWRPPVAAVGAVLAAVVILPPIGLTALAWTGAVALGLWAVRWGLRSVTSASVGAATAAGALAGAALLFRPDLVLAIGLGAVVLVPRWSAPQRRRGALALGAVGALMLVQVAMAGPGDAFEGMVVQPVLDLRGGRHLPLPPSWSHFDGFLQRAGTLDAPSWPLPAPASPAQLTLWFLLLLTVVAGLVVTGRRRHDVAMLAVGAFSAGLLPQALQRPDTTHLAWVSCVPLGFLPALLAAWRPAWRPSGIAAAAAAVPLVLVPHFTYRNYLDVAAETFDISRQSFRISHGGRDFYYGRRDAAAAADQLLAAVEARTEPGDRLLVGPGDLRFTPYSDAYLYYLLPDRPPATRYIEMDPGIANAVDSGLAGEVAAADVVVLSTIWDAWDEPNDSRVAGPDEPDRVLARDFCLAGRFGDGHDERGLYELYLRRGAGACQPSG